MASLDQPIDDDICDQTWPETIDNKAFSSEEVELLVRFISILAEWEQRAWDKAGEAVRASTSLPEAISLRRQSA